METIVIEGKDYKCSKRVAEEILWMDSQVKTAKELARQIEDLQDELDTQVSIYQSRINDLIQQIKNL